LKAKTEIRLIKVDVTAIIICGAIPIELIPGVFMGLWGWSWWLAGLVSLLIETTYIYGSYHTTRWFVVRKEVVFQDRLVRWFAKEIEQVKVTNGDSSFFIRILRRLVKLLGLIYRQFFQKAVKRVITLIQIVIPKLHRDSFISRSLLFLVNWSYAVLVTLAGFVPWALRPTVIILALRNRVDDCRFVFVGTAFKLFICSYFGAPIYRKLFKFTVSIYDFFESIFRWVFL